MDHSHHQHPDNKHKDHNKHEEHSQQQKHTPTGDHSAHHDHSAHPQPQSEEQHAHDKQHSKEAHNKHAGHHTEDFLKRFWICLLITVPILLLSPMIQHWIGIDISFPGSKYLLLALGTAIYIYGGMPFLKGMVSELRNNAMGMMTLVAIAITVSFFYSVAVIFGLAGMDFFWELATLIDIMLLGHWLEMRSEMAASRALESLVELLPATVHIEVDGAVKDIPLQQLKKNDTILVKPGEKIAADGLVLEGSSTVNESMLTGESMPVQKEKDAKVIAGSVNENGVIKVRVTGTGSDSYLNKVIQLVQSAQAAKSNTQNLADKVAKWLTIISIIVGVLTFIYWITKAQGIPFALERLVTVMVTACPHALGVAIPLVVAISTSRAAIRGLLIRNRTAFENARKLTTIIFDKTGTLTKGTHAIRNIIPLTNQYTVAEILQYTAAVQQNSEHFIGKGIMKKLGEDKLELWPSTDFSYLQGIGVSAKVKDKIVIAGGPNYFSQHSIPVPEIPTAIDQLTETVIFILFDKGPVGIISFEDSLRETSAEAVAQLKEMGIKSFLLTGDNEKIAAAVAGKLKMDGYLSNVLPHQKQEKVKEFQAGGKFIAMTGDGVNDAPALAQADVGIAVGTGTDVAAETADIILVNSDPLDVVKIISFGKATYAKMIQNLFWAVGYNIVAIPLAAGILYPNFVLSPAVGAILMSASTIIVAINAQLLRYRLK
ncbi:copper-translocating P-type ATPase [Flavihumibacter sp.]|uniref:copper-translocating P-type ATPase n=1 Tax=Flavihumibacter sp. TaxID=1913981 RepID=UPI002FCA3742